MLNRQSIRLDNVSDANASISLKTRQSNKWNNIVIRECVAIDELDNCIRLQREVFGLPDLEISPRRHLIVSRQAGGWTLGAFVPEDEAG